VANRLNIQMLLKNPTVSVHDHGVSHIANLMNLHPPPDLQRNKAPSIFFSEISIPFLVNKTQSGCNQVYLDATSMDTTGNREGGHCTSDGDRRCVKVLWISYPQT